MVAQLASAFQPLREADWLNPQRVRAYGLILAAAMLVLSAAWIASSGRGLDPTGKPLGTDFLSFWAASELALQGTPERVYDTAAHAAAQQGQFGEDVAYSAFFYPPVFLLICLPLALLPYFAALALWLGITAYGYWRVVAAMLGDLPGKWLPALAFPAAMVNIGHGQNGFLSMALLGGGILLVQKRPILSGVLFGCLIFKPHLAILLPVALAARGEWKSFIATGLTAFMLAGLSLAVFGLPTWQGFLSISPLAREALEGGLVGHEKMQSAFAAVRVLGGSVAVAYWVQGAISVAIAMVLVGVARSGARPLTQGVAYVNAALLATPFLLDYDLTILALVLAWLFNEGRRGGFLPWEKILLFAGFILPLVSRLSADLIGFPPTPLVVGGLFVLVVRRALRERLSQPTPV